MMARTLPTRVHWTAVAKSSAALLLGYLEPLQSVLPQRPNSLQAPAGRIRR